MQNKTIEAGAVEVKKVGILPVSWRHFQGGKKAAQFLIYIPNTQQGDDPETFPWQLARGSIEPGDVDLRDRASAEAWEELGIIKEEQGEWQDLGKYTYTGSGDTYGIHFYSTIIDRPLSDAVLTDRAVDGYKVGWYTAQQVEDLIDSKDFKAGYADIFRNLAVQAEALLEEASEKKAKSAATAAYQRR